MLLSLSLKDSCKVLHAVAERPLTAFLAWKKKNKKWKLQRSNRWKEIWWHLLLYGVTGAWHL
eukprot:1161683-Pelagomonas_calceolata.AAC.6